MLTIDNKVSHSFDKRGKYGSKAIASTEDLKRRSNEDNIKINFGYKPPLHGNNRGFAAQMAKNRRKYFNKNSKNNLSVNTSSNKGYKDAHKYVTSSTAEARLSKNYSNKLLNYNDQESTSINDSEPEYQKSPNKISHHARIKDKLKLLKGNLRNIH